jgi:hypothetical protein
VSTRNGNAIKESLIKKEVIKKEEVTTKNARIILLGLSKKGEDTARKLGYKIKKMNGKAGLEHEYWRNIVGKCYERCGYKVSTEIPVNGTTDIVAEKDLKADFTTVFSVATSRSVEKNQKSSKGKRT